MPLTLDLKSITQDIQMKSTTLPWRKLLAIFRCFAVKHERLQKFCYYYYHYLLYLYSLQQLEFRDFIISLKYLLLIGVACTPPSSLFAISQLLLSCRRRICGDNYSSVTTKHFVPYKTPDGKEELPMLAHQKQTGFTRQPPLTVPTAREVNTEFLNFIFKELNHLLKSTT